MKAFLRILLKVLLLITIFVNSSEIHEAGDHGHYEHHHGDHKYHDDHHNYHHDDHHNIHHSSHDDHHNDHYDPHKHHHDHHEQQHDHFEHHEVLKEYLTDQQKHHTDKHDQKANQHEHHNNQHEQHTNQHEQHSDHLEHHSDHGQHDLLDNPLSHYLHHDDHHHEDDLTPMQRKIREMTASKDSIGDHHHFHHHHEEELSPMQKKIREMVASKASPEETHKPFVRNAQTQSKTEAKKETNEKEKTKVSDKSKKHPTADEVYYKDHCHIKEADELHQLPANLENRKLTRERALKSHWWEFGQDIMLQRFTVLLPYGDHCFHQPVFAKSKFICFFKDYNREPILATLFDSKSNNIHREFSEHGNLTATPKHAENYHVCFRNQKYYTRKLFVIVEVEAQEKMALPSLVKSENRLSTWIRRIQAILQYRITCSTIETNFQEEFLNIMERRSVCLTIATFLVLLIQTYFIHHFFDQPNSNQITSVAYRMGV